MMKKKTQNTIVTIFTSVEGFILYMAQMCDPRKAPEEYPFPFCNTSFRVFYPIVCEHIQKVALAAFILLVLLIIIFQFVKKSNKKEWLGQLFKHILNQHLGGSTYETRITLYAKTNSLCFFFKYLCYALEQLIHCETKYIKNLPNPFKAYLTPYVRWTYPNKKLSLTYFRAIDEEGIKPESIVEKCYKLGKTVYAEADSINDIVLPEKIDGLKTKERKLVEDYMKKTEIPNYKKLRSLQRKANCIYAFPVRKKQESWGVVVIDRIGNNNTTSIEKELELYIESYQKIIQMTINSLEQ